MNCPCCNEDLWDPAWKHWSDNGSERFELICPNCGNKVVVVAKAKLNIRKVEVINGIDNKTIVSK